MAKKQKDIMNGIKLDVEFSYSSDLHTGTINDVDYKNLSAQITDVSVPRYLKNTTARCNLNIAIPVNKMTIADINNHIYKLECEPKFTKFLELTRKIQQLTFDNTKPVFPELVKNYVEIIPEKGVLGLATINKNKLYLHTNQYRHAGDLPKQFEIDVINILTEFEQAGLLQYVDMSMHFVCWNYFFDGVNTAHNKPAEFLAHRREYLGITA